MRSRSDNYVPSNKHIVCLASGLVVGATQLATAIDSCQCEINISHLRLLSLVANQWKGEQCDEFNTF